MKADRMGPTTPAGGALGIGARLRQVTLNQWLTLGVLLATIAGSSVTWYALALRCAWPQGLAAVPTIGLDLGGLLFGRNWILGRTRRLQVWGRITTILAVLLSVGGNSIEHAIAADRLGPLNAPPPLWLVLAVGAVAPAVLFAVAHQVALEQHADQVDQADDTDEVRTDTTDLADARTAEASPVRTAGPKPDAVSASATSEPRPSGTVLALARRAPENSTLLAEVHAEYRRRALAILDRSGDLDEIVLADVDREAGAKPGYAKRHARRWRTEIEAEQAARREG